MRPLTSSDLLELLDRGHHLAPVERALLLLAHAWRGSSEQERAALPIGRRDALLIALRAHTFGTAAALTAACKACGEQLEATLDLAAVLAEQNGEAAPMTPHTTEHDGRTVTFRLPSSSDLLALTAQRDDNSQGFVRRLLQTVDGVAVNAETPLPPGLDRTVAAAIEQADPLAEIRFAVVCAGCTQSGEQIFDIVPFFWQEIEDAGKRVIREIHALASAYGWTEGEILRLSPARRAMYLRQVWS